MLINIFLSKWLLLNIIFKGLFILLFCCVPMVSVCDQVYLWVQVRWGARRGRQIPWNWTWGGCELPYERVSETNSDPLQEQYLLLKPLQTPVFCCCCCYFVCFEMGPGSHVAQAGLKFWVARMTLNFWSSCWNSFNRQDYECVNIYTTGPYIYKELGDSNWKKRKWIHFQFGLKMWNEK